jgi:hypothetical protein
MLSIPLLVKFLPPLEKSACFRNTRIYAIAWNTWEGHSFRQRFSEGQHNTPFIHRTEGIESEWHKAVPQVTSGMNLISTIQWWQIDQQISHTHTHTHTHTQIGGILIVILVMNFLPSIYWIPTLSMTISHLTPDTLVHSISFHSVNDILIQRSFLHA